MLKDTTVTGGRGQHHPDGGHRKPFFAAYTDHMLNFYVSTFADSEKLPSVDDVIFKNDVDALNWLMCDRIFRKQSRTARACCYALHNTPPDDRRTAAEKLAETYQMPAWMIWKMDHRIQFDIAVERGLISREDDRYAGKE